LVTKEKRGEKGDKERGETMAKGIILTGINWSTLLT